MGIYRFNPEDAARFAKEQGIASRTRGNELQFKTCPYCRSPKDTYTFAINLETGQFNCKRNSCGASGNMLTLMRDFDFSLGNDTDEYYRPRKKFRNFGNYPLPETRDPAVAYMETRGIPAEITRRYHITTRKDNPNIIVFPFLDENGKMQFIKYRNAAFVKGQSKGSKEWCERDCRPILFGMDQCDPEKDSILVMTEGQIDSLSVAACGIRNAVSVPTGAKGFTWTPYCWDFLTKFDMLIVFGDYENGKITLLDEMRTRFKGRIRHVKPADYLDCKDANELLLKHGKQAIMDAVSNAVAVSHPLISKLAEVEPVNLADMESVESGIDSLDAITGGFFFGQLVILTGKRGLGKSTLGSQFIVNAIQHGYTSFIYSGEMKSQRVQEWIDRQIAGAAHISYSITKNRYKRYQVNEDKLFRIHSWYEEYLYFYNMEALLEHADDDEEVLGDTALLSVIELAIKQYCCRVFFIDNLMIAMDEQSDRDLNLQQTTFVKKLASMARIYNVLIFLVAHPRKSNGSDFDNDDVSGSSNITNLADIVLQYGKPKDGIDGDRTLRIAKNRMTGKLETDGIPLWFEESSKRISDHEGQFAWYYGWEANTDDDYQDIDDGMTDIPF